MSPAKKPSPKQPPAVPESAQPSPAPKASAAKSPAPKRSAARPASDAPPLRVLYVCSEVYPWLKTGGLADVSAALPPALRAQGVDVRLLVPGFPGLVQAAQPVGAALPLPAGGSGSLGHDKDHIGPRRHTSGTHEPWLQAAHWAAAPLSPPSATPDVHGYVLHAPDVFNISGNPYTGADGHARPHSAERFGWLGWAAARLCTGLDSTWRPDVLHGHDWHTGLGAAYLHALAELGERVPPSVFTIHNLAYQGLFDAHTLAPLGLPGHLFQMHGLEFHGQLSFMKAGLKYSTALTTVSPTYATEITHHAQGHGLDGVLRARQNVLSGILNGVDPAVWDPATDRYTDHPYHAADLSGKAAAKADLQARLGLAVRPDALLFVVVSRLTDQKGLHLLPAVMDELVSRGGQLAVLGEGDAHIEHALRQHEARHPGAVAFTRGYDEALAHRMVAGGDVIMVPSKFEPCGLTQLYGLRYGTLPLVRAVGGLADTVTDCALEHLHDGTANGFVFHDLTPDDLARAMRRAFALFARPAEWRAVQRFAMGQQFDWQRAAQAYVALYRHLIS